MKTSNLFKAFLLLPATFACTLATAQNTSGTVDNEARDGILEEVLVTATRRGDADILTTPIAMTKLVGDEVTKFAIRDLNDIAVSIPGLSSGTVSAFKSASFAMRGVSETTIILYKESPVGVTLDEFVVPHIQTSNLEVFDIETFEVLRGPQGTLFGKNTTGGVINVRTKRPVLEENSGQVGLQYGSFDTKKANVALNFAAGETLAFRFRRHVEAFFSRRESGGRPVGLTASAGLACYPEDATRPEELLECAAQALYHAKAAVLALQSKGHRVHAFRPRPAKGH